MWNKRIQNFIPSDVEVAPTASQNCFGIVSDSDYEMETQIISIAAGFLSATLSVSILDDELVEVQECLIVFIQSVSWAQEGRQEQISFDTNPLIIRINDLDSGKC